MQGKECTLPLHQTLLPAPPPPPPCYRLCCCYCPFYWLLLQIVVRLRARPRLQPLGVSLTLPQTLLHFLLQPLPLPLGLLPALPQPCWSKPNPPKLAPGKNKNCFARRAARAC